MYIYTYIYIYIHTHICHVFTWVRKRNITVETACFEIARHSSPLKFWVGSRFLCSHCENGSMLWQFQWRKIGYAMAWGVHKHKPFLGKPMRVRVNESQRVNIQGGTGSHVFLRLFEKAWCFCSRATWHFFLGPEFVVRLVYIILIVGLCNYTLLIWLVSMLKSLLTSIYWLVSSPNKSSTTGALQPLLLGDPTGSCGFRKASNLTGQWLGAAQMKATSGCLVKW